MQRISEPQMVDAFTRSSTSPCAGRGTGSVAQIDFVVAGQICGPHALLVAYECSQIAGRRRHGGVISPFTSQRSSQDCPSFQRKTWPLISRQLRSMAADFTHVILR